MFRIIYIIILYFTTKNFFVKSVKIVAIIPD